MKSIHSTNILLLLLLMLPLLLHAKQQYSTPENFNQTTGLPNSEVQCLLKDSKGYLWVGTTYGLAKYDGNKFSIFKHQSNSNSISGDVITSLFENSNGDILVGANGLSILKRQKNTWDNYLHDPSSKKSISNPVISSIAQENDSIYWLITSNGLNRFNIKTGVFEYIDLNINTRIVQSSIHSVISGESVTFSVGSNYYRYNLKHKNPEIITEFKGYHNVIVFNNNLVGIKNSQFKGQNLIHYDIATGREHVIFGNVDLNSVLFQSEGILYLIQGEVIYSFNKRFNRIETIVIQQRRELPGRDYTCALREENGTFWIGTNGGLQKVSSNSLFQFYDIKSGLPNEYVRSITIDHENNLWIGVRQGPVYKILNVDTFLQCRNTDLKTIHFPTTDGTVYATNRILELKNGNILFVTNRSLFLYNSKIGKFTDEFFIPDNQQYFAAVEVDDGILIGSLDKPSLFKIKIERNRIKLDKSFSVQTYPDAVYSLFMDSKNDVWIGSEGLYKLISKKDQKGFNIEQPIPAINDTNYSSNSIWSFLELDSARLFVSTTNNGFYTYNRTNGKFKHFSKADGLATDFTCTALKDANNNLWLSTKEGISFINSRNFAISNYPVRNGRYNSDFTFDAGAVSKNGSLFFGSKQGVVFFYPDSIQPNDIETPLYVNEFRVFDRIVKRELTQGDTIVLRHNQNFFSMEFSLLDFRNPKEIDYNFQLLKYDKAERQVSNNFNSVSYTNVTPGRYTFRLTSVPSWNTDNKQTIDIVLIIKPAYYQTGWFKASIYLTIILIIASIVISIIRRQILRGRLQRMELNLLRSQINPHFIFNTLTSIQHTILTSNRNEAVEILSRFSRLMRMFLDYSRLEYITLDKAILFYKTFVTVHSVNLEEKIDFRVVVDDNLDIEKVTISPMLIQPFLENAIVHGLSPKEKDMLLTLQIDQSDGWLSCIVSDNGIGRKRAQEIKQKKTLTHKSMGIEISSKSILLQLKKGKFIRETFSIVDNADEQGNPTGTTVYLKIPFKKE